MVNMRLGNLYITNSKNARYCVLLVMFNEIRYLQKDYLLFAYYCPLWSIISVVYTHCENILPKTLHAKGVPQHSIIHHK